MQQKLITFAVPCYNSAAYMRHCIETLLSAGEQAEIILVDDGSVKDDTPAICDEYAAKYPTIVKAIHQENGGHGEGVNQGIRNATGLYYKVVDSDDWLDTDALKKVLARLTTLVARGTAPDMMICNYVYEHVEDNTTLTVRYTNVFPQNRLFNWTHVGHFRPDQNILMHSVMYRTEVLRKCGMVLPKHTFYVDNIFVYQPLPYVKSMYYMDLDLYRYFIGRADQSVNESIMVKRVDQQLRVTRHMIDCQDLDELKDQKRLHAYMVHYLSVMMAVSDIFLLLDGSDEAKAKRTGLWQYLKDHVSTGVYRAVRYNLGGLTDLKFPGGDKLTLGVYRQLRKIFKFNCLFGIYSFRHVLRRASSLKEGAFGRMEHFSFSPEPPSVRKTPPAGGGGTKVPEGEWVASHSDDGRSFFYLPDRSSLPGLHIPVTFCLGG